MKFLFDLFPILLFFLAYHIYGIYAATATAIGATVAQIAWVWIRHRKIDTMLWVSSIIIVVFGGATLWSHNETFIKWKPTVLYWFFSISLFVSATFLNKNLICQLMNKQIQLPDTVWNQLNAYWIGFFALMGGLNLWIAYHFSTDTWVNFKLFGSTGLTLLFVIFQGLLLSKHLVHQGKE